MTTRNRTGVFEDLQEAGLPTDEPLSRDPSLDSIDGTPTIMSGYPNGHPDDVYFIFSRDGGDGMGSAYRIPVSALDVEGLMQYGAFSGKMDANQFSYLVYDHGTKLKPAELAEFALTVFNGDLRYTEEGPP
jgi:hypothetical protein